MSPKNGYERPAIAGSGTIATGLAACASTLGEVTLLARSDASAWRAEEQAQAAAVKLEGAVAGHIRVRACQEASPLGRGRCGCNSRHPDHARSVRLSRWLGAHSAVRLRQR